MARLPVREDHGVEAVPRGGDLLQELLRVGPEPPLYVEVPPWDQYRGPLALRRVPCVNLVTEQSELKTRL